MDLSPGGALLVYLILASGLAAVLVALYLMPRRARGIELVGRDGQVAVRYAGSDSSTGYLYYRDRGIDLVVYLGDDVMIHPKADWFTIRIHR